MAWPWGACWGSGLGPRVHVGEGVWNFGSLDPFGTGFEAHRKSLAVKEGVWNFRGVAALQTAALRPIESHCCGSEVPAGDGVWRVWQVLEGLERLEGLESFGGFAGWQTAALKA